MKYGFEAKEWKILDEKVIRPLKARGALVWIFGSRATGTNRKYSDVDLLYEVNPTLPPAFLYKLRCDIEDSDLPVKVDLVSMSALAAGYRKEILKQRTPV